jgi:prevent-host-death family protein
MGVTTMTKREPATQTINATEARAQWSKLLNDVFRRNTRVIIEKSGIPVAAIISARDLELWQRYQEERERSFRVLDETRAAFADVPDDELEREVERALAEVRAERRREAVSSMTRS